MTFIGRPKVTFLHHGHSGQGPLILRLGSIPYGDGVSFRLWTPHAEPISVIGCVYHL